MKLTKLFKRMLLAAAMMSLLPQTAAAYNFKVGGLCYNYTTDSNGTSVYVTYERNNTIPYYSNLSGAITIPASVTLSGKTYSVTSIGNYAFYYCSGLTSVTIPNSVTSIGNYAFDSCSGLTSVTIPNSVTSIGNYAFTYCTGLTSVTIPNSVTSIGNSAFSGCSGLASITVELGNTVYDSRDNCNAIIETATNTLVAGCKNTIIPNSVTSIGNFAFNYCRGLTSVTIPNSVTSIGNYAFDSCSGLTSVTIPNSVTSIGGYAFQNCSKLTSVTIPNSVTSISSYAFSWCSGLTSVTIGNSVTFIGQEAFRKCSGLKMIHSKIKKPSDVVLLGQDIFLSVPKSTCVLVVPESSLGSYQSAIQWNEFTNIMVEITSFNINNHTIELEKRKEYSMGVSFEPQNAWDYLVWGTSDNSVATVDENGVITGVSLGTTIITATSTTNSNLSNSCVVTVIPNCDVNDDNRVDITDINQVINKMLEKNGAPAIEYADINGDGEVDIFDINEVIGYMLGYSNDSLNSTQRVKSKD